MYGSVRQAGQSGLVVVSAAMGDKPSSLSSTEIGADRSGGLAAVLCPFTMVCPLGDDGEATVARRLAVDNPRLTAFNVGQATEAPSRHRTERRKKAPVGIMMTFEASNSPPRPQTTERRI